LDSVVTQNIDGLHQQAGNTTVLEVHGTNREIKCLGCGARQATEPVYTRVRAGDEDPACLECGGMLKSATISFGEAMPLDVVDEAYRRVESCDVCLVVGSSLVVFPAADIPAHAVRSGATLAIVNNEPTPLDHAASVVVHDAAGPVLSRVVDLLGSRDRR
jgi:NAD-dependent deacetylase